METRSHAFTQEEFDLICEGLNELLTNREEFLELVERKDRAFIQDEIDTINALLDRL